MTVCVGMSCLAFIAKISLQMAVPSHGLNFPGIFGARSIIQNSSSVRRLVRLSLQICEMQIKTWEIGHSTAIYFSRLK